MEIRIERMAIAGMSCGHCVAAVRRALGEVDGVEVRDVSVGSAEIAYDPAVVEREVIGAAIDDAGFSVAS